MTAEARGLTMTENAPPPDTRMSEFMAMAQYQAENILPQNTDVYTKSFEIAFFGYLRSNRKFRALYRGIFDDNHGEVADEVELTPDDLIRQNIKTFQFLERERSPNVFPYNRATPEAWHIAFDTLLNDEDYQEDFFLNIYKPLASNVSERGSPIKAEIMLHGFERPNVFDAGCSLNHLLKRVVLEDDPELTFSLIDIARRLPKQSRFEVTKDEVATGSFNRWLRSGAVTLGNSIGADIIDYAEEKNEPFRKRAFSDSHYMGQLTVDKLTQQAQVLEHVQPGNVSSIALDMADFDPSTFKNKFDVTVLSTMLYISKSSPSTVDKILENARAITADDGIIIVQDFIRSISKSGKVGFYKRWPKYSYGVWVENMQRPDLGLQKHFSVFGGRIEAMIPEAGLAHLPEQQHSLARTLGLLATVESYEA